MLVKERNRLNFHIHCLALHWYHEIKSIFLALWGGSAKNNKKIKKKHKNKNKRRVTNVFLSSQQFHFTLWKWWHCRITFLKQFCYYICFVITLRSCWSTSQLAKLYLKYSSSVQLKQPIQPNSPVSISVFAYNQAPFCKYEPLILVVISYRYLLLDLALKITLISTVLMVQCQGVLCKLSYICVDYGIMDHKRHCLNNNLSAGNKCLS